MKNCNARLIAIFAFWVTIETPAFAYLDGATGSILLQAAIGLVAGSMVYYRTAKERVRLLVARLTGKAAAPTEGE